MIDPERDVWFVVPLFVCLHLPPYWSCFFRTRSLPVVLILVHSYQLFFDPVRTWEEFLDLQFENRMGACLQAFGESCL